MRITGFTLAAAFLLVAGQAAAQSGASVGNVHWTAGRAEDLIAQAEKIQNLDSLHVKAKLLEQAAGVMETMDPRRPSLLLQAGSAYYFSGNARRAVDVFERAAAVSDQMKDVLVASDAYYTLLALAVQERRTSDARRYVDRMVQLADAPSLTEAQRTSIWRRISIQLTGLTVPAFSR